MLWLYIKNCESLRSVSLRQIRDRQNLGFTLIEILVVIMMVGILTAIAAPSWLSFVTNNRLSSSQSRVFSTLRDAQSTAKRGSTTARFVIGNDPTNGAYIRSGTSQYQYLEQGVRVLSVTKGTATPPNPPTTVPLPLTIEFNSQGLPTKVNNATLLTSTDYPVKITVGVNNSAGLNRCTSIVTILGSLKSASGSACN
jgi:prepilin-type N-terminal cleavage/methylation domain-containing protein